MKRSAKYVALDVHQATTVASVREQNGRVIARSILPTEQGALVEFFRGMRGSVHVAFEESTQAQWLHDLLVLLVDRVIVCDRRGESRQGNKGDRVDADELSRLLRRGGLRAVYHGGGSDRATLKELTRAYSNLVEDSTRVMLRLKALFRARAIRASGKRVYGVKDRTFAGSCSRGGGEPLERAETQSVAAMVGSTPAVSTASAAFRFTLEVKAYAVMTPFDVLATANTTGSISRKSKGMHFSSTARDPRPSLDEVIDQCT